MYYMINFIVLQVMMVGSLSMMAENEVTWTIDREKVHVGGAVSLIAEYPHSMAETLEIRFGERDTVKLLRKGGYIMLIAIITSIIVLDIGPFPPIPEFQSLPTGHDIIDVTSGQTYIHAPKLNDCGEIVYHISGITTLDSEIYYYDNGYLMQFTSNRITDRFPDINNLGHIARATREDTAGVCWHGTMRCNDWSSSP